MYMFKCMYVFMIINFPLFSASLFIPSFSLPLLSLSLPPPPSSLSIPSLLSPFPSSLPITCPPSLPHLPHLPLSLLSLQPCKIFYDNTQLSIPTIKQVSTHHHKLHVIGSLLAAVVFHQDTLDCNLAVPLVKQVIETGIYPLVISSPEYYNSTCKTNDSVTLVIYSYYGY